MVFLFALDDKNAAPAKLPTCNKRLIHTCVVIRLHARPTFVDGHDLTTRRTNARQLDSYAFVQDKARG